MLQSFVNSQPKSIAIFGATGFIARYVVNELGPKGWTIHFATRGDDMEWRHLKPLCEYGKLVPHYFSPKEESSVTAAIPKGVDVVLNLVGKRYDTKHYLPFIINNSLEDTHVRLAQSVARAARRQGAKHLVHVSSAQASKDSASRWAKTKALGEAAAREEFPGAAVIRPGRVYGEEDRFLNFWAWAAKRFPVLPLVDNGSAKLRPVFVGDVAKGIAAVAGDVERTCGETIDLMGKDEYTLRQVVEYVSDTIGYRPTLVNASSGGGLKALATVLEKLPNPLLTPDQLELMKCSETPAKGALTFETFGLKPQTFESKAYNFLFRYRTGGHFVELRDVEKRGHVSHIISQQHPQQQQQ